MARRRSRSAKSAPRTIKGRYTPAEWFVAILGLGFLVVVVGMIISSLLS